jgi:hypothetical protein
LEQAYWDIIVIDEAHNVAKRSNQSQRHKLAELLSTRSDTLIMLSATPHDGKAESFASLMNMLDPTAIANPKEYQHEDFRDKGLVIRRFKKSIADQLSNHFPEREIKTEQVAASPEEEHAFTELMDTSFHTLDGKRQSGAQLFRTTLEKTLFSSPAACISTIDNRLKRLNSRKLNSDIEDDISTLEGLRLALSAITPKSFSKYQLLLDLLKKDGSKTLGWQPKHAGDRLVIFTESLVTLTYLEEHLPKDLKLKKNKLAVLRGTMRDSELIQIVEDFGKESSPIRLLLCSDVASEGINLHHLSHRMIHFDIPWSLMVFQQRNGRIDRYGQTKAPQIRYLMTLSSQKQVRGDQRILEVLVEKDEQAGHNIGDPSEFMGVYSAEEEEAKVAAAIEQEKNLDDISDIFADLFADNAEKAETGLEPFLSNQAATNHNDLKSVLGDIPNLFPDDLSYAHAALAWIKQQEEQKRWGVSVQFDVDAAKRQIDFTATRDLQQRLKFLPREARPENDRFILTDDKAQIQQAIRNARDGDNDLFSSLHYLWQQHPVMEWLMTRVQDGFGRHTAPVIRIPSQLEADEHWFIVQGGFPNKRGQALIQQSLAILVQGDQITVETQLADILKEFKLQGDKIPNKAMEGDCSIQRGLLPKVVQHVRNSLKKTRDQIQADKNNQLQAHLAELEALRNKHLGQLELELSRSDQPEVFKQKRKQDRMHHIECVFNEYNHWLEETQHTEDDPYIQIVAVITGQEAQARKGVVEK